jgi:hypothetical protein
VTGRLHCNPKPALEITLQTFRAYLLDAQGKITWGDWIEAASEKDALEKAKALCREGIPTVEVWQGTRKIGEDHCFPAPAAKPRRWLPSFGRALRPG